MRTIAPVLAILIAACSTEAPPEAAVPAADAPAAENAEQADAPEAAEQQAATEAADANEATASDWTSYGQPIPGEAKVFSARQVLDNPANFTGTEIVVEGEIADVCQKMGCWAVLTDGERNIRITMKDHAYGIDMQSHGASARMFGTVTARQVDADKVAHLKSESKHPEQMPENEVAVGEDIYEFVAAGVSLHKQG